MCRPRLAVFTAALACCPTWASAQQQPSSYSATWASVDQHPPAPEWFQDAKFGIYYHWGAFGTAMFGNEWYPRNMFNKAGNSAEYQHHLATYGDPYGSWGYDKFLTGANDKSGNFVQFAPKLKSAGGNWDPDEWAQMFHDAGAWFAGPVAEHHDGFSMWDSKVNEWNSVALGPKLNLAKLHADAIRKQGMKLFMSLHHEWNFGGYWAYGTPTTSDPSLQKLYGKLPNDQEQTLWLNKLKEVIDEFLPDILYQDRYVGAISEANRLAFLAYYYNAALKGKVDVVAVAKEGITDHPGQVYDYERGGPADIRTPYWMTDDAVGSQSWCYVSGLSYYTDAQFIGAFVDRVSKGGNMILNVSPMPDGTFPQRQKDILKMFGTFLKQMGTAIYNTRAWTVYGEGPTKLGGGEFTSPTALTASDVRYTKSKDSDALYAILGGWPGNGKQVNLTAVTTSRFALGTGKAFLFGPVGGAAIELPVTQDGSGVHVTLPSTQPYTALAYAIKLSKSGTVPAPTPDVNNGATGGMGGMGGIGGMGGMGGTAGMAGSAPGGMGGTSNVGAGAGGRGGSAGTESSAGAPGVAGMGGAAGTNGIAGMTSAGGIGGAVGASGTMGAAGHPVSGSAGTGSGVAGSGVNHSGTGGTAATNGGAAANDSTPESGDGCGCAVPSRHDRSPASFLALVFAAATHFARRRKARTQRSVESV